MKKIFVGSFIALMLLGLSACDAPVNQRDESVAKEEIIIDEVLEPKTVTVNLYYYNLEEDKKIAEYIPCSADAVLPVEREISDVENVPEYTLKELLKGEITAEEAAEGFQTEFAPGKLELKSLTVKDGVATVDFFDDKGFSSGGSCRVGLLAWQIQKTLLQFDEIDEVEFANEEMFQP